MKYFQQSTGAQRLTPLMIAALNSCRESVETLLQLGADPDALSQGGCPALFFAIIAGDQVITEKLAMITTKGDELHWSAGSGDLPRSPLATIWSGPVLASPGDGHWSVAPPKHSLSTGFSVAI